MYLANLFNPEVMIIALVIVLVLFGGKKIPELLRGVGRGVGELQKGLHEGKQQLQYSVRYDATPTVTPVNEAQPRSTQPEPPAI